MEKKNERFYYDVSECASRVGKGGGLQRTTRTARSVKGHFWKGGIKGSRLSDERVNRDSETGKTSRGGGGQEYLAQQKTEENRIEKHNRGGGGGGLGGGWVPPELCTYKKKIRRRERTEQWDNIELPLTNCPK